MHNLTCQCIYIVVDMTCYKLWFLHLICCIYGHTRVVVERCVPRKAYDVSIHYKISGSLDLTFINSHSPALPASIIYQFAATVACRKQSNFDGRAV